MYMCKLYAQAKEKKSQHAYDDSNTNEDDYKDMDRRHLSSSLNMLYLPDPKI